MQPEGEALNFVSRMTSILHGGVDMTQRMQPATPETSQRLAEEVCYLTSAPVGERLAWPRAALFVLGVCAALWLGLGFLLNRLFV